MAGLTGFRGPVHEKTRSVSERARPDTWSAHKPAQVGSPSVTVCRGYAIFIGQGLQRESLRARLPKSKSQVRVSGRGTLAEIIVSMAHRSYGSVIVSNLRETVVQNATITGGWAQPPLPIVTGPSPLSHT